jgi:hypothetical protein
MVANSNALKIRDNEGILPVSYFMEASYRVAKGSVTVAAADVINAMITYHQQESLGSDKQSGDVNEFTVADGNGDTLLHHACRNLRTRPKLIQQVLLACPEAAAVANNDGHYPFAELLIYYEFDYICDHTSLNKAAAAVLKCLFRCGQHCY